MTRLMSLRFSSTRASWPLKTAKGSPRLCRLCFTHWQYLSLPHASLLISLTSSFNGRTRMRIGKRKPKTQGNQAAATTSSGKRGSPAVRSGRLPACDLTTRYGPAMNIHYGAASKTKPIEDDGHHHSTRQNPPFCQLLLFILQQRSLPFLRHKEGKPNLRAGLQRLFRELRRYPDRLLQGHIHNHKSHKHTFS